MALGSIARPRPCRRRWVRARGFELKVAWRRGSGRKPQKWIGSEPSKHQKYPFPNQCIQSMQEQRKHPSHVCVRVHAGRNTTWEWKKLDIKKRVETDLYRSRQQIDDNNMTTKTAGERHPNPLPLISQSMQREWRMQDEHCVRKIGFLFLRLLSSFLRSKENI